MRYFFKRHEENFKEWRNAGYQGIPPLGAEFLKHLRSRHFKPKLALWNEEQMITKGRGAFYNKI